MVFSGVSGAPAHELPEPAAHRHRADPAWSGRSRSCTSTAPATTGCSCRRCAPTRPAPAGTNEHPGRHVDLADPVLRRQAGRPAPPPSTRRSPRAGTCSSPRASTTSTRPIHVNRAEHRRPRPRPGHDQSRTTASPRCTVADVDGVKVAGLLFDAGTTNSPVLMEVGPAGSSAEPRREPDLAARRVLPHRRRRRRQGHQQPDGQQQQRDRRPHVGLARRPRQRRPSAGPPTPPTPA